MNIKVLALMVGGLSCFALAQNAPAAQDKAPSPRIFTLDMGPPSTNAGASPKLQAGPKRLPDSTFHSDVLQLIELSGVREQIQAKKKPLLEKMRKNVQEKLPQCSPAFSREWAKRMGERMNTEEFLEVYVQAYEKYLTQEDVTELIELEQKEKAKEPAVASARLQRKLHDVLPSILGDTVGGCAKIGAELGGSVGEEIRKEHPDYCRATAQP